MSANQCGRRLEGRAPCLRKVPVGRSAREAATELPHLHLSSGSLPRVPSPVHRLHRNWERVCFVMGLESQIPTLLGRGENGARVWGQTTGLGIPIQPLRSSV